MKTFTHLSFAFAAVLLLIACGDNDDPNTLPTTAVPSSPEIVELEARVAGEPNDDELYGQLGNAYREIGRSAEAITKYQEALTLQPEDSEWVRKLRELNGDFTPIIDSLKNDAEANSQDDRAQGRLGKLLINIDRVQEGIPYLFAALRLDPADLEWADLLLENGADITMVIDILENAPAEIKDYSDDYWGSLAKAYHRAGRLAEARRAIAQAKAMDPDDYEWQNLEQGW